MLDLNVLLDVALRRSPHFATSLAAVNYLRQEGNIGMLPVHGFTTMWYVLRREKTSEQTRSLIAWQLEQFEVAPADGDTVRKALESESPDLEDAVVSTSAMQCQCEFILTRDEHGFGGSPVPSISPEEFVKRFVD